MILLDDAVLRAVMRGLHIAGCFVLFGNCVLQGWLLPGPVKPWVQARLRVISQGSFAVLFVAGICWFVLQTVDMSGAQDAADVWQALPVVAGSTRFGGLLIGRLVGFVLAALALWLGWRRGAAVVAGAALAAEGWLGHGGAMPGPVGTLLLGSAVLHLLSGGVWLGSLPGLWVGLRGLDMAQAAVLARRFSPLGAVCVIGLLLSASVQFLVLIGSPAALLNNGYGQLALLKMILLLGLLALAAVNRYHLAPRLPMGDEPARRLLLRSVVAEMALGLLAVLAAGMILQLAPPAMAAMLGQSGG